MSVAFAPQKVVIPSIHTVVASFFDQDLDRVETGRRGHLFVRPDKVLSHMPVVRLGVAGLTIRTVADETTFRTFLSLLTKGQVAFASALVLHNRPAGFWLEAITPFVSVAWVPVTAIVDGLDRQGYDALAKAEMISAELARIKEEALWFAELRGSRQVTVARFARLLLELLDRYGVCEAPGKKTLLPIKIGNKALADILGTDAGSVSKLITALKNTDVVERAECGFRVLNLAELYSLGRS